MFNISTVQNKNKNAIAVIVKFIKDNPYAIYD